MKNNLYCEYVMNECVGNILCHSMCNGTLFAKYWLYNYENDIFRVFLNKCNFLKENETLTHDVVLVF